MERIEVPQFDMRKQRVIKNYGSHLLLKDDEIEYFLKVKVETPDDEENEYSKWHERNWYHHGFIKKSSIVGINIQSWDTYPDYPSCSLFIESYGHELIKFTFKTISEAKDIMDKVREWLKKDTIIR